MWWHLECLLQVRYCEFFSVCDWIKRNFGCGLLSYARIFYTRSIVFAIQNTVSLFIFNPFLMMCTLLYSNNFIFLFFQEKNKYWMIYDCCIFNKVIYSTFCALSFSLYLQTALGSANWTRLHRWNWFQCFDMRSVSICQRNHFVLFHFNMFVSRSFLQNIRWFNAQAKRSR